MVLLHPVKSEREGKLKEKGHSNVCVKEYTPPQNHFGLICAHSRCRRV
jgi:hypothetical protein